MTDLVEGFVQASRHSSRGHRWYVCPRPNPGAKIRLFVFPFAGGSPSAFTSWVDGFSGNVEAHFAHYPGRGSRYNEPPIRNLNALVEQLVPGIEPLTDKPFAFFGHSMGGLIAFELARQLRERKLAEPRILFVSACGAPQIADPHPPIHSLSDSEFQESLKKLNGIPAEVSQYPEMMQLLTPMIRADFELIETYHFKNGGTLLNCPIIAFGGTEDPRISHERLEGWAFQTSSRFEARYFPGDHFFVNSAKESILQFMALEIQALFAKNESSI